MDLRSEKPEVWMPDRTREAHSLRSKDDLPTRRDFSSVALMALLAGVTVTVTSCGDSPTQPENGANGSIAGNHGHSAVITDAELDAGNGVTLNIQGSADHPHTVVVTMQEVGQIAGGQRISKTSSSEASASTTTHNHVVTFN
jgi:hypothetical protein